MPNLVQIRRDANYLGLILAGDRVLVVRLWLSFRYSSKSMVGGQISYRSGHIDDYCYYFCGPYRTIMVVLAAVVDSWAYGETGPPATAC